MGSVCRVLMSKSAGKTQLTSNSIQLQEILRNDINGQSRQISRNRAVHNPKSEKKQSDCWWILATRATTWKKTMKTNCRMRTDASIITIVQTNVRVCELQYTRSIGALMFEFVAMHFASANSRRMFSFGTPAAQQVAKHLRWLQACHMTENPQSLDHPFAKVSDQTTINKLQNKTHGLHTPIQRNTASTQTAKQHRTWKLHDCDSTRSAWLFGYVAKSQNRKWAIN